MKAEYANVFISSAVEVFKKELNVNLTRKNLSRKNAPVPSLPISIVIGIAGAIRGQVVYSVDSHFAIQVTRAMMPGKSDNELKELMNSAVSEIANMITGQSSIVLAGDNDLIHLTPPAVFTGKEIQVDFLAVPTICLSMISEIGALEINIAFTGDGE